MSVHAVTVTEQISWYVQGFVNSKLRRNLFHKTSVRKCLIEEYDRAILIGGRVFQSLTTRLK